jgi:hypothetical protein
MAPKPRPAVYPAEPLEETDQSSRDTPSPPPDAIVMVLEQMAFINVRFDERAAHAVAQRHRDAKRDTQAPTHI